MIHQTAIVHPRAKIGTGVSVGPFSIIHANVEIGSGTEIQERVSIGTDAFHSDSPMTRIGPNSVIRSGSVLYHQVTAGENLSVGHNAIIREGSTVGKHCSIGSGAQLQGDCMLGNRVRIHSNVHFGEGADIEDDVWIFSNVLVTTDPNPPSHLRLGLKLGKESVVMPGVIFMPGVTLAPKSVVLPMSKVTRSFKNEGVLIGGVPARELGPAGMLKMADDRSLSAYPWKDRFSR